MKERASYSYIFLIITSIFVTSLITANIVAVKIISLFGLFFPAGLIVFPITYIFGDILTEVYGYKKARIVIWLGFFSNLLFVLVALLAQSLPSAPFWVDQSSYEKILGNTPRLLTASFLAYLVGSFSNAFVMSKMKTITKGKYLWTRTIGSTIIGEGLDSLIFINIAFFGVLPTASILPLILTQWGLKISYEVIITPLTYKIVGYLKRREKTDLYDYKINYNPFSI